MKFSRKTRGAKSGIPGMEDLNDRREGTWLSPNTLYSGVLYVSDFPKLLPGLFVGPLSSCLWHQHGAMSVDWM